MFLWRDDEQCGAGWHLPGGCVRLKETLEQRLHVCAKSELGTDVLCDMKPVLITENIEPKRDRGRTHFISFLYQCVPVDKVQLRLLGIHITMTQPNNYSVQEIGKSNYTILTCVYTLIQWAVPVFLMISGNLLLHSNKLAFTKVKKMSLVFVTLSYYFNITILNVAALVIACIYAVGINWKLIKMFFAEIRKYKKEGN